MAASRAAIALQPSLLSRLEEARARTDSLFNLLPPNSFYDRPVPERHRLIFYLGHLEAFDQNLLSGPLGSEPQDATLDKLFAFGIDPVGGGLPTDVPGDWPNIANVEKYKRGVRERLDARLHDPTKIEEAIEEERPNVILLDVVMPQRNGFQACRDLKNHESYSQIPVILVTSKTAPSDRYWGEQQGANGYVAKPFTPEELLSAVKRFA